MSSPHHDRAAPRPAQRVSLPHVGFIAAVHAGALLAPLAWTPGALAWMLGLYVVTGLGITVGYHRLLAHRAFEAPDAVRRGLAFAGVLALQGGPLRWCADHREHHLDSDGENDPHDIGRGFLHAHLLWLFYVYPGDYDAARIARRTRDLARDPVLRWLERHHAAIGIGAGGGLLLAGGLPWFLWGFCARLVLLYHCTWLVNSAAHRWGPRPFAYATGHNNWLVALLAFGEGWHNNHHAWPAAARQGFTATQLDVSWILIRLLGRLGLARRAKVVRVDPAHPRGGVLVER